MAVCPTHALYLPVLHEWQVLPPDGWYLPTGQSLQVAENSSANVPWAHVSQDTALTLPLNLPDGQAVHPAPFEIAEARNSPATQAGVGNCVGNGVG